MPFHVYDFLFRLYIEWQFILHKLIILQFEVNAANILTDSKDRYNQNNLVLTPPPKPCFLHTCVKNKRHGYVPEINHFRAALTDFPGEQVRYHSECVLLSSSVTFYHSSSQTFNNDAESVTYKDIFLWLFISATLQ